MTRWAIVEKAVLAAQVTTILASSYPRVDSRWWAVWVVVVATVVGYALLDHRARRGRPGRATAVRQLAANMAVSLVAMAALGVLVPGRANGVAVADALLFAYVVGLMTTLYDRWASAAWVRATPEPSREVRAPRAAGAHSAGTCSSSTRRNSTACSSSAAANSSTVRRSSRALCRALSMSSAS
ncbi:hypothetical protein CLV34_2121 [Luteimicrobium subarcticum]|uniref:Uncharacterized protein n=1 Tax=Luteimicrobium subarcticum TaxID=620910 RepID=A0A2M8WRI1_9MICO|nr:hypothetical protein CLV34_2121 [Luteimicrobium subarcticum]